MSFARTLSAQTHLLTARIISIEADVSRGIHSFSIVGLPDKAVEEAKDRMASAIKYAGFASPRHSNQKIVISMAPADIPKAGPHFDLSMAMAYLLAAQDVIFNSEDILFLGELSLDGRIRTITGTLPLVAEAQREGMKTVFLPKENCSEAALIEGVKIYGAETLLEVIEHLDEKREKKKLIPVFREEPLHKEKRECLMDMSSIRGQESAKRALLIAAAGGHNIALWGPPGTGKTMLAKAFSGLLPKLTFEETLEVTAIYSVAGLLKQPLIEYPPFRSPHHTASYHSLVGGGSIPRPGEITLAHKGVLFLDELPEFDRQVLDAIREPLEEQTIRIARVKGSGSFPADFILLAAMNPCPCGNFGVKGKDCTCSSFSLERYKKKISGPIIDRIDMWIEVSSIDYEKMLSPKTNEAHTATLAKIIEETRNIQRERHLKTFGKGILNARTSRFPNISQKISKEAHAILNTSAKQLSISGRSYQKIICLSRTIADLERKDIIEKEHILEALQYRHSKISSVYQ